MSAGRPPDPVDRTLENVFEAEGRTRAPDRMLEDVFARTKETKQARRRPWDARRLPTLPGSSLPLVVAAVLVLASIGVLAGTSGGRPERSVPPAGPSAPAAVAAPSPAIAKICPGGEGLGGDAAVLWVGCPTGIRRVDLGVQPWAPDPLVEGVGVPVSGGVGTWAIRLGGLTEVDPVTGPGRVLEVTGVSVLAAGADTLWGGTLDRQLLRIDPATGTVSGRVAMPARPLAIVEAGGRVWVSGDDGQLRVFDGGTLAAGPTVTVGTDASAMAADATAVFVASHGVEGTVTRVDLATGALSKVVLAEPTDPRSLGEVLLTPDGLWVTRRTTLFALDPATLVIGAHVELPSYANGLVADGPFAWVHGNGRLDRVRLP